MTASAQQDGAADCLARRPTWRHPPATVSEDDSGSAWQHFFVVWASYTRKNMVLGHFRPLWPAQHCIKGSTLSDKGLNSIIICMRPGHYLYVEALFAAWGQQALFFL